MAKLSGQLGECWAENSDSSYNMSRHYNLNDELKRQYLQNFLQNNAARFYVTHVELHAATFQIAADIIFA